MKSMRLCIVVILFIGVLKCSADEELDKDDEDYTTFRFHRPHREQECNYRRQPGKCRRKSECKRPTRRTCRHGRTRDPIICCLDLDETTTTTKMPTTTKRITTRRPTKPPVVNKPDNMKNINLTFPNCGLRSPKIQEVTTRPPTSNRRRGALSSFIGRSNTNNRRQGSLQGIRPVVVGGVETKPHSWPWMVAIFKTAVPGGVPKYLCGASLISRRYVVSAAHCFDPEKGDIDASKFTIVVGAHTTKDGIIYPVEQVHVHTGYQKRQYYYDISLLKTSKPVILTKKVYPICLPSDDLRRKIVLDENRVTVTGWGDTAFGGISSKVLQEVTMPVVPLKDCNESFSKIAKANFPHGITNLFICAGEKQGGKDACQGDSGGPLVTKLKDNSYVQLGVVSFGYGCGQAGYPGVYTRLSEYTKWFYENTDLG